MTDLAPPGMPDALPRKPKRKPVRRKFAGWRIVPDRERMRPACTVCWAGAILRPRGSWILPRAMLTMYTAGEREPLQVCLGHAEDLGSSHDLVKAAQARRLATAGRRG